MIILELIGRKKFQEISGLSDEEYELLIKNAYISPYSEEDNKSYFFENEAEFTKAKKDEWLREARDMEEWAKENPELDAFQQEEEIDNDNFDSDCDFTENFWILNNIGTNNNSSRLTSGKKFSRSIDSRKTAI